MPGPVGPTLSARRNAVNRPNGQPGLPVQPRRPVRWRDEMPAHGSRWRSWAAVGGARRGAPAGRMRRERRIERRARTAAALTRGDLAAHTAVNSPRIAGRDTRGGLATA